MHNNAQNLTDDFLQDKERFRVSEQRFRAMLDASPMACCVTDNDYNVVDCNQVTIDLFELKDKQEYCDNFMRLSPQIQPCGTPSGQMMQQVLSTVFSTGSCTFAWMHCTLTGKPIPCEITLKYVELDDMPVTIGYIRDLRDQIKMSEAIQYRDALLKSVNQAANLLLNADFTFFEASLHQAMKIVAETVQADRMFVWQNSTKNGREYCTQIYEWSENATPQQGNHLTTDIAYEDVMPDDWHRRLAVDNVCINGIVRELPPELHAHLAAQGILSVLLAPIFMKDHFWGFIGFDDCTRERVFTDEEEATLRSSGMLVANAVERNLIFIDLRDTTQQLESALQQANAASKAKGDFLSVMSHEMRTPMNTIIGMAAIGIKKEQAHEKNYALDKISQAANHLLGVINDILDMAKIEANKMELVPIRYDFRAMIKKAVALVSFIMDEKEHALHINIDPAIPDCLVGDEQRISQIIANLLSNAAKFTPVKGKITLTADATSTKSEMQTLCVSINDNGVGIPDSDFAAIFQTFHQAHGEKYVHGGTGLGLSITKRIVELMDGNISVVSEPGMGSTFTFTIPLYHAPAIDTHPTSPPMANKIKNTAQFAGKKMLLVEDIDINREILVMLLEGSGLEIDQATNGQEALEKVTAAPDTYDIIFMDIQMPVLDGLEATKLIRAWPYRPRGRLPIIALTANIFKDDIENCLAAGMDGHLGKPFDMDKVLEVLQKYIC